MVEWETRYRHAERELGQLGGMGLSAAAWASDRRAERAGGGVFADAADRPFEAPSLWIPWGAWRPETDGGWPGSTAPFPLFRDTGSDAQRAQIEAVAGRFPRWFFETVREHLRGLAPPDRQVLLSHADSVALRLVHRACIDSGLRPCVAKTPSPLTSDPWEDGEASGGEVRLSAPSEAPAGERLLAPLLRPDPPSPLPPRGRIASHAPAVTTTHVARALGFDPVSFSPTALDAVLAGAFYKWGVRQSRERLGLDWWATRLGRPMLVFEDGVLLRSVGIGQGADRDSAWSVSLDPYTAYYDSTRVSWVERRLSARPQPSEQERTRARACMDEIARHRLSKYNNAPDTRRSYGPATRPRILIVDQHRRDASVRYGLASERSFDAMLRFARQHRPEHTLLLKMHPDSVQAGSKNYLTRRRLARHGLPGARAEVIADNVNPHTLLDQVDEVFVVTSGLGFEALLRGRSVHCFGVPFYAGWGLTHDHVPVPRRGTPRELEHIFHTVAIEAAQYIDPDTFDLVPIEAAIDRFARLTAGGTLFR